MSSRPRGRKSGGGRWGVNEYYAQSALVLMKEGFVAHESLVEGRANEWARKVPKGG